MVSSYRQILRSSSIMGGAQVINYLVSLVRVKIVAVLLGPSGIGLVGLYTSAMGLVGALTGFGLGNSGVRAVADAYSRDDPELAARMVCVLRRTCWLTGLLGWVVSSVLAVVISRWLTGSSNHAWAIAILGSTLFIGAISSGQLALLQGLRRIGDIARANVLGAVLNTLVAILLYAWLGEAGIVPVLIVSAVISLLLSYGFARRIDVPDVSLAWHDTWQQASALLSLGIAFMWSGLLTAGLDMYTRAMISRELGLDAAGIYQAAWALSGLFAGFILQSMAADFYPRLTSVIADRKAAIQLVNEQTEIGILLALPGLLALISFAPWVINALYSRAFAPAAEVLAVMVLGVFGRVVSFPLGYILLALGAGRRFMATETLFLGTQAILIVILVPRFGVIGAAYSFSSMYIFATFSLRIIGGVLIGFQWSLAVKRLLIASCGFVLSALCNAYLLTAPYRWMAGIIISCAGCAISLRGLVRSVGDQHWLVLLARRMPGAQWLIGSSE